MIRKHKKYTKPKKMYDKARIEEENSILKKYGLKNKREIWKADAAIRKIRNGAKKLIASSNEEQTKFLLRLKKKGFKVEKIADVLALNKEDYLKRRLQTLVVEKKIATTMNQARQLIAHKHIAIGKSKINVPSYIVPVEKENLISCDLNIKEKKQNEK